MEHVSSKSSFKKEICYRILIAAFLGYALTISVSVLISFLLPLSQKDAVAASSMLSFALYTGYIMYVFSAKRYRNVFINSLLVLAVSALVNALMFWLRG